MSAATCPERIPLDMTAIVAQAQAPKLRRWRVEFDCSGRPFVWEGSAEDSNQADAVARDDLLFVDGFSFHEARTVACCEVRS